MATRQRAAEPEAHGAHCRAGLIGVALVTGASVFAASIKVQLRDTIGSTFVGDYVINSTNGGSLSFSQTFIDQLNTLPEVGTATGLGFVPASPMPMANVPPVRRSIRRRQADC